MSLRNAVSLLCFNANNITANVSSYCILQFRSQGTKSVLSGQSNECNEVHLMAFGAREAKEKLHATTGEKL